MVGWPGSRQNSLFTITADTHEVRHNPEYYVMRHFSKYVRPGAKVLGTTSHFNSMAIAFRNPDGTIVVVTQNALEDERPFEFADPACLCSISCCGFSHDDFSGLGRACRPRNGLNWMVLVSPPERTGKDYDQHAPSTVYPSFAAERGIRRVDRAENTCQRADGA